MTQLSLPLGQYIDKTGGKWRLLGTPEPTDWSAYWKRQPLNPNAPIPDDLREKWTAEGRL